MSEGSALCVRKLFLLSQTESSSDIHGLAQSASHSSPIVVVGEVLPCQGFGDLGYDGLGLGAGGHAGDKKISKIKQSFQTYQGSVQQSTEVV